MAEGTKHGTLYGYTKQKCRCDFCTAANRIYHLARWHDGRGQIDAEKIAFASKISVHVTGDQEVRWTERALAEGISREALVRRCVDQALDVLEAVDRMEAEAARKQEARRLLATGGR